MINALKRLAKDNLTNLHPHPLYVWFYYSHPPLIERIEYLQKMDIPSCILQKLPRPLKNGALKKYHSFYPQGQQRNDGLALRALTRNQSAPPVCIFLTIHKYR